MKMPYKAGETGAFSSRKSTRIVARGSSLLMEPAVAATAETKATPKTSRRQVEFMMRGMLLYPEREVSLS
jgi:hypothetical protein